MSLLPAYRAPDFSRPEFAAAPAVRTEPAPADGILPAGFHATSNYPEYINIPGKRWTLVREGRMDASLLLSNGNLSVVEPRHVKKGDHVIIGRSENGEEGIFVHTNGFTQPVDAHDKFSFSTRETRETPFSRSYDMLYEILKHDQRQGFIVWVLGPAVVFDQDSRDAMATMIKRGYCHAMMAGNALATHDLEAAHFRTALGRDIYTGELQPGGHCHHLDIINMVNRCGSIPAAIHELGLNDGIMAACVQHRVPYILAGSIRDDGPLPDIISNTSQAQDAMRIYSRRATTVIALATQLHSIAFGNMLPGYQVGEDGTLRPVFFYVVDMSEFSVDKLANRGSMQAIRLLTNVQDFMVNLKHNLT